MRKQHLMESLEPESWRLLLNARCDLLEAILISPEEWQLVGQEMLRDVATEVNW